MYTADGIEYVRASEAGQGELCPASAHLKSTSQDAREGTAFHRCIELIFRGVEVYPDMVHMATWDMINAAIRAKAVVDSTMTPEKKLVIETRIFSRHLRLTAKPDLVIYDGDYQAEIIDWKWGYAEVPSPESNLQLLTAALIILELRPDVEHVTLTIAALRQSRIMTHTYTRGEIESLFLDRIKAAADRIFDGADDFVLGAHCGQCYRAGVCPAFMSSLTTSLSMIERRDISNSELVFVLQRLKKAGKIIDDAFKMAKAHVEAMGPLIGDGLVYDAHVEEQETIPYTPIVEATLHELLGDRHGEAINRTISKDSLAKVCRSIGRGVFGNTLDELRKRGLLETKHVRKYSFRQITKEAKDGPDDGDSAGESRAIDSTRSA